VFNDYNLAGGAAVSGLGVLIGRTALVETELQEGRLVERMAFRIPSPRVYCLVRPTGQERPASTVLWNWLLGQARRA
jgi:DNA-binding transcriptional LysR family regulator